MSYTLYYYVGDVKKDKVPVKLFDIVRDPSDPRHVFEVVGWDAPNERKGGVTGKVYCVSNEFTTHTFYPTAIGMSFWKKKDHHMEVRIDRYGREAKATK